MKKPSPLIRMRKRSSRLVRLSLLALSSTLLASPSTATESSADPGMQLLQKLGTSALENNPAIQSVRLESRVREQERNAARQQFLPTPSISIDRADQPARTLLNQRSTTLRLQQPIWTGGRLSANLSQAEAAMKSGEYSTQAQEHGTLEQLIQTLARHRQARQRTESLGNSIATHERLLAQVQRRVREGLSPVSDLSVAESRLLNVRSEWSGARLDVQQQARNLQKLLGRPLDGDEQAALDSLPITPPSGFPVHVALIADPATLAHEQPRYRKLQADRQQLDHRIDALKANRQPQLNLRMDKIQGDVSGTDHVAVLSLSTNWGAGLSNEYEIEAVRLKKSALDQDIEAEFQENARRISTLQDELRQQLQRYDLLTTALQRNREFMDSTERLYLTGRKAWLDVLNSAREVAATEIATSDALLQAWNSAVLLNLLGQGSPGFLGPTVNTTSNRFGVCHDER